MRLSVAMALMLVLPGPLTAQAGFGPTNTHRAEPVAAFQIKGSELAGADRVFLGGWAGLILGNRIAVGGEGLVLAKKVELAGTGFDLSMGYGGLTLRSWIPLSGRVHGEASLLLGAGHAKVRTVLTGREEASDNFGVLEPEVSFFVTTLPWLHLGASGGYRMAWGVEDLPRVTVDDLRSYTASLFLRVGGG